MPFAMEPDTATTLGVLMALFLAYMHMGREYAKYAVPNPARFAE